ncbi:hypothetical protein DD924_05480, partial [Staphylococcus pseudintermedius]
MVERLTSNIECMFVGFAYNFLTNFSLPKKVFSGVGILMILGIIRKLLSCIILLIINKDVLLFMSFFQSPLISNIIAFGALICSIWSIVYTYSQNKYQITISEFTAEKFEDIPLYFCFDVINTSTKGIRIKKIELIKNGEMLNDLQFEPTKRLVFYYPNPSNSPLYS